MLRLPLAVPILLSMAFVSPLAMAEETGKAKAAPPAKAAPAAPAAPATPAVTGEKQADEAPKAEGDTARHGLFGPLRVGVTAALGFPHPITYGVDVLYDDLFSGAIGFGSYTAKSGSVSVGISNWDLRGRWHPFGGSFFLGAAYGSQTIDASVTDDLTVGTSKTNTKIKLEVQTTYLTPHLGWFKVTNIGFTIGFEVGYQMALSSTAKDPDVSFSGGPDPSGTDQYKKNNDDIKKAAESFGKTNVPYITLIRLGWML